MRRIEALTFLRFVVAVLVVVFHFGVKSTGALGEFSHHAVPRLMSFFFTLSGFVLMLAYYDRPQVNTRQFYVGRLARVAPLYLLALAITIPFVYGESIHTLTGLILSATFLQAWVFPYNISFNDPAWAVSVEVFFYAIFPLLIYWVRKRNLTASTLLWIALAIYAVTQAFLIWLVNAPFFEDFPSWSYSLVYFFPPIHFCSLLLGMAGGLIYLKNRDKRMESNLPSYVVLIGAFALDFLAVQYADSLSSLFGVEIPTYGSFHSLTHLGLILAVAFTNNQITRAMSWKPFVFLGGASYAVYILQRPVSFVLRFAIKRLHIPAIPPLEGFLVLFAVLLIVSILAYRYVEPAGQKLVTRIDQWFRVRSPKQTRS